MFGNRHNRQSFSRPALDWSHPLTNSLVFSAYNCVQDATLPPFNYVGNKLGALTGTTWNTCERGIAQTYNGSSDTSNCAVDLSPCKDLTVSFWLYWDNYTSDNKVFLAYPINPEAGGAVTGFGIVPNSSSGIGGFLLFNVKLASYSLARFTRPSNGLHHFSAYFKFAAGSFAPLLYIDGVRRTPSTTTTGTALTLPNDSLYLFSYNGGQFGAGKVLHLNLHSRQLDTQEVGMLYTNPNAMFRPIRRSYLAGRGSASGLSSATRWFLTQ